MLLFSHILIMCFQPGTLIQIMQNKCLCFCLKLGKKHHISGNNFGVINWLPTTKRVDQRINTINLNFIINTCPYYLNEISGFISHCRIGARNNFSKLKNPFHKNNMGQKKFLILVPLCGEQLA